MAAAMEDSCWQSAAWPPLHAGARQEPFWAGSEIVLAESLEQSVRS